MASQLLLCDCVKSAKNTGRIPLLISLYEWIRSLSEKDGLS